MCSNDTSGDLILENINTGEKFILRQNEPMYRCGRTKTNHILSQSILVSREHCIFLRVGTQIHVIDKKSSNGIYINGIKQQPNLMVALKINDIIGLGTQSMVKEAAPNAASPTIYVLRPFELEPLPSTSTQDAHEILTQLPSENSETTTENKRKLSRDRNDTGVPCKIPKIEETTSNPVGKNQTDDGAGFFEFKVPNKILKDARRSSELDIIDITEENSSDDESMIVETEKLEKFKEVSNPSLVSSVKIKPENEVTSSSNDVSRSLLMDDADTNENISSSSCNTSREVNKILEKKQNEDRPSVINMAKPAKKRKKGEHPITSPSRYETISESGRNAIREPREKKKSSRDVSGIETSPRIEKSNRLDSNSRSLERIKRYQSEDCSSTEDEEIGKLVEEKREKVSNEIKDEAMDFMVEPLNLDDVNLEERMEYAREVPKDDNISSEDALVQLNDDGVVQWIKYEPELSIVDENESFYKDTNNSMDLPAPTPLKLKRVKQETKTRYSELDVVTLSDDEDDDFFPASQLFGDEPEDRVKIETEEESEARMFEVERNDVPDIVLLSDSENEDNALYNRVLQSSLNESRDFYVKKEPEEDRQVPENNDRPKGPVSEEEREIYNLCFADAENERMIIDDTEKKEKEKKKKKKKKRSSSLEKLQEASRRASVDLGGKNFDELEELLKTQKQILEKLERLKETEKIAEDSNTRKVTHEERSRQKKRDEPSSKPADKRDSIEKKDHEKSSIRDRERSTEKSREAQDKKQKDNSAKSRKSDKHRDRSVEVKSMEKSDKESKDASEDRRSSREKDIEKSRKISCGKSGSIGKDDTLLSTEERSKSPIVLLPRIEIHNKGLQIVDAPFLAKGERRSVSYGIKKVDKTANREAVSTSEFRETEVDGSREEATRESSGNKSKPKEIVEKLTTKQKKEMSLKAKQEEFSHHKEQKLRRMKNKWAECLPPRKHQGLSLTRQEKEEIKNDRKEKLKKIADEKKKLAENNESASSKRTVTKAIAKVTEKTRSYFLVNEMEEPTNKKTKEAETPPVAVASIVSDVSSSDSNDKRDKSLDTIRSENLRNSDEALRSNGVVSSSDKTRRDKLSDALTEHFINDEVSSKSCDKASRVTKRRDESIGLENVNPANARSNTDDSTNIVSKVTQQLKSLLVIEPRHLEPQRRKITAKSKTRSEKFEREASSKHCNSEKSRDPRMKVDSSAKSLGKKSSDRTTTETPTSRTLKRVSFNELMNKVQVYEIQPENTMKKCPTTDAPVLVKQNRKKLNRSCCPKLEQFLLRIFNWKPAWLQEQTQLDVPPPIVDEKSLIPLLSRYGTYEDYYKIMEPLLALELWYQITKGLEIDGKNSNRRPVMASIVNNSISLSTIPSTNIRVTRLILEIVVSRQELELQTFPVYGDLVFFEYASKARGTKSFCTVFAYVENITQAVIEPHTYYNRDLLHYVQSPYAVLSYSVVTKPLDHTNIQTNRVYRMRSISYLRANMRMVQSLQYLPVSPLMNQILHPDTEDYQLPEVQYNVPYSFITKDTLNTKQLEAVIRISEAVVRKIPKVCLIQGPPGTGKSKVIVNLVTEILYGNGRYGKNKKMRILVCAPSNAAIDEIVIRLLDIRKSIPESKGRFKMVRIGRPETMHPMAKSISLQVLAKKDVKTTTENYMSPALTIDSVEEEKRLLLAKINSQQLELSSAQSRNAPDVNYLAKTLSESKSKLDLLTNRRPLERIDPKQLAKLQRGAENTLLMGADVIACTLTSSYTGLMESIFAESGQEISVCIVDEATQCVEVETLIPLMLGVRTLVLVGDTHQLPATIISQKAKEYGLGQSLFARIQKSFEGKDKNPVIQLDTQYRMSWPVAFWPNRYFYAGVLKNAATLPNLPFHFYKVMNLDSIQNNDKFTNTEEANFVANLLYTLMGRSKLNKITKAVKVGIITPYNNQKDVITKKIRDCIASLSDTFKLRMIYDVNTVDSFQGQERDVIIMSCVRSNGIGFLSDSQRLCVALTRAKHSLILCGNFRTFEKDSMWSALLSDAKSRGAYINIKANATPDEIRPHVIR